MENRITAIDRNLAPVEVSCEGMKNYDINQPPFRLYGLSRESGECDYKRLPHKLVQSIENSGLKNLYTNTAGLRLRFRTNSKKLILRCTWDERTVFDHMPMTGVSCFDLYADGQYCNVLRPGILQNQQFPIPLEEGYETLYEFPDCRMRDLVLNFPLYNNITALSIALDEQATVLSGGEYTHRLPIVYYGSSITQGGCASHAGNSYQAIISRRLNADFLNLGFSGSCKAEPEMAEYLASVNMSLFVYDYDHNAPDVAYLEKTHEPLFRTIREKQPHLPVLMISAADTVFGDTQSARRDVIRRTYENARNAGDRNVYFLDGETIYRDVGVDLCTVDGCHPNDLGFWCMANAIEEQIKSILGW